MSNGTSRPVLIMNGVLAGLGVILAGAALADYLSVQLVGLLLLIHSGVAVAWGVITQQGVTPNDKVLVELAAPSKQDAVRPVATPALADRSVLNAGDPVDVTAQAPTDWTGPRKEDNAP